MKPNGMKFRCENCGQLHLKWVGKCSCGEWNSLAEITNIQKQSLNSNPLELSKVTDHVVENIDRIPTNISEFDRTIGGGLVPGCVILISGDPGIGKSTLLLQISNSDFPKNVIYISGEESVSQITLRAKRLKIQSEKLHISSTNCLEDILATLELHRNQTTLAIVDSIQTISSDNIDGIAGSISQIRYCAQKLIEFAKNSNVAMIIVGHVTKEGTIAGPKILEHSVDTVLHFEGERNYSFRVLRSIKNRFGSTDEIGIFEIDEEGLKQIDNPSLMFLNQTQNKAVGSIIFPSMDGARLLMIEIQALVATSFLQMPRRAVVGWDNSRLPMICAVLEKHCKIGFGNKDVYLNVIGGLKINEPAADLPVLLAILSSHLNIALPTNFVAFGEVGLSGEIRNVQYINKRINESQRLACNGILMPKTPETKGQETKIQDASKPSVPMHQFDTVQKILQWLKNL